MIYTDDHEPAHVHVIGAGLAKIHLLGPHGRPEIVDVIGIKRSDMRRLFAEVTEHRDEFMREWERIHPAFPKYFSDSTGQITILLIQIMVLKVVRGMFHGSPRGCGL